MSATNKGELAPRSLRVPSQESVLAQLEEVLKTQFKLPLLSEFTVVVEGVTDRDYLHLATELASDVFGYDLLSVPEHLTPTGARIQVVTPLDPKAEGASEGRERGGIPQVVRLAKELRGYVFTLAMFRGLVFIFDGDEAGCKAQNELKDIGYAPDRHAFVLAARDHPAACTSKNVVIEDLLSLRIQKAFFEQGRAWCSADYEDGEIRRFSWGNNSKHLLRDYVRDHATWPDVREIGRVLARVRRVFGLDVPEGLFTGS